MKNKKHHKKSHIKTPVIMLNVTNIIIVKVK